jgi:hypothetical protein
MLIVQGELSETEFLLFMFLCVMTEHAVHKWFYLRRYSSSNAEANLEINVTTYLEISHSILISAKVQ